MTVDHPKPTDEEIVAVIEAWKFGIMTHVVRKVLASYPWARRTGTQAYRNLDTAFVRRRLIALEKAGRVKRMESNHATMIRWSIA